MLLDIALLERCTRIDSHDELQALLADVRSATSGLQPADMHVDLESAEVCDRAAALLCLAAHGWPPEVDRIRNALRFDSAQLLPAAALCLVLCLPEAEPLHRKLLLGSDPWSPPLCSRNATYHLIRAMGISADPRFVPILYEALRDGYHFCPRPLTSWALAELGAQVDEEKIPVHRSITVMPGANQTLLITTDERYSGQSNCVHCSFFPCRINRYFKGGIEDCKLWNRVDPASLGEILDTRDWGQTRVDIEERPSPDTMLDRARNLMERGEPLPAILHLCSILIETAFKTRHAPVAWINLSRCFSACGEPVLAFIAMREGAELRNLIGASASAENEALSGFEDDPATVVAYPLPEKRQQRLALRAIGYQKHKLFTRALDIHAELNIHEAGRQGGAWFEMGECHRELGELHLAELCMRQGARRTSDSSNRESFLRGAEAVRTLRLDNADPGLALGRRTADRAAGDPPGLPI